MRAAVAVAAFVLASAGPTTTPWSYVCTGNVTGGQAEWFVGGDNIGRLISGRNIEIDHNASLVCANDPSTSYTCNTTTTNPSLTFNLHCPLFGGSHHSKKGLLGLLGLLGLIPLLLLLSLSSLCLLCFLRRKKVAEPVAFATFDPVVAPVAAPTIPVVQTHVDYVPHVDYVQHTVPHYDVVPGHIDVVPGAGHAHFDQFGPGFGPTATPVVF